MPLRPNLKPREYLDIVLRRKWFVIFLSLFIVFGATVYCVVTPERFKSSTTILIIPQRVPESYVRGTATIRMEDRLRTLQQQVMSRTRLLTIMDELGLFSDRRKKETLDLLVEEMRKRVEVQVRGSDSFTLTFSYEDPRLTMLGASRLASLFIDENLKTREQQAVGTSEFLESQLRETKAKLEGAEERVKQYKMRYMGELPEELASNLAVLGRLQDQLRANSDGIRSAEDRRVFLDAQLGNLERTIQGAIPSRENRRAASAAADTPADPALSLAQDYAVRKARVAELEARYTDLYPELVRARKDLAQIEKRIADARSALRGTDNAARTEPVAPEPMSAALSLERGEYARLRSQLIGTEQEISSLRKERAEIIRNIGRMETKVATAPKREQEMVGLTRDYDNLKRSYDDMMRNKLQADVAENLEKRQKGEQFQVLDPANLPTKPSKPQRPMVMAMAFFLAIGVAVGGAIILEMLDPTLRGIKDFRHFFDAPVLACIPVIRDAEFVRRNTMRRVLVVGGLVSFAAAATVFVAIYGGKIRSILNI